MSPYLFILCTEGFSSILKKVECRGDIHGIKVYRGTPVLSHILFGGNCFLFCMISEKETTRPTQILDTYERASGQMINLDKSYIFFSTNTQQSLRQTIMFGLGVSTIIGSGKYLGLSSINGRTKKAIFNYVDDRIWKCINHRSGKYLSKAGKEVLIKSCAQAMPSYTMSIYLLPTTLKDEIQRMLN